MGKGAPSTSRNGGIVKLSGERVDTSHAMTYQKIFELKFKKGFSTSQLFHRFPDEIAKVAEIALLQVPTSILKKMVPEEANLSRILSLKRKFRARLD